MEPLTKGIVIFGATGDLCKKKLIPALYKLWTKDLLPKGFSITGASRRDPSRDDWLKSLGEYPEEFTNHLDYISCDLDDPESLYHLPETDDTTYFLSVPPERYENAITSPSKDQNYSTTQKHPVWLLKNPLGTILNLLIIYSQWWADIYAKNKYIALTIILAKILLIISLPLVLVMYFSNHYGIGST